jgi:hypothetical protein
MAHQEHVMLHMHGEIEASRDILAHNVKFYHSLVFASKDASRFEVSQSTLTLKRKCNLHVSVHRSGGRVGLCGKVHERLSVRPWL